MSLGSGLTLSLSPLINHTFIILYVCTKLVAVVVFRVLVPTYIHLYPSYASGDTLGLNLLVVHHHFLGRGGPPSHR